MSSIVLPSFDYIVGDPILRKFLFGKSTVEPCTCMAQQPFDLGLRGALSSTIRPRSLNEEAIIHLNSESIGGQRILRNRSPGWSGPIPQKASKPPASAETLRKSPGFARASGASLRTDSLRNRRACVNKALVREKRHTGAASADCRSR